jgi:hypothetical protein
MAIAAKREGVNVNGAGIEVLRVDCGGRDGRARLYLRNTGAQPLGANVKVQMGPSPVAGAKATFTTALAGVNNDLAFTAVRAGQDGNAIALKYTDPAAPNAPLRLVVVGNLVEFQLATNGASAIISTANDLLEAWRHSEDARKLVDVALAGGNDGTGVVTALAQTPLAGGTDFVADIDTTTLATLAAGVEKSAFFEGPIGLVKLVADQGAGATTVSAWLEVEL